MDIAYANGFPYFDDQPQGPMVQYEQARRKDTGKVAI